MSFLMIANDFTICMSKFISLFFCGCLDCFQFFTIIKSGVLEILDHIFVPREWCFCIRGVCLHNTLVLIAMLLSRKIVPIYAPRRA